MAKIKLVETGYTMIPEGTYIFKVNKVTYDEDFGDMKIELITKNGLKHTERFGLQTANGEVNEGAMKAFSYTARVLLNNPNLDTIDEQDLVGCYMKATVTHKTSTTVSTKTGKPFVNVVLDDKQSSWGFDADKPQAATTEDNISLDDLDELV
jgi:hypothetical protein